MLKEGIKPYASNIWNYEMEYENGNLIDASDKEVMLILLPRTLARFTRKGLIVNKLRYGNNLYMEEYLQGREVIVAYNPDNVNHVYLYDKGSIVIYKRIYLKTKGD